jgi:hypothetical protein
MADTSKPSLLLSFEITRHTIQVHHTGIPSTVLVIEHPINMSFVTNGRDVVVHCRGLADMLESETAQLREYASIRRRIVRVPQRRTILCTFVADWKNVLLTYWNCRFPG